MNEIINPRRESKEEKGNGLQYINYTNLTKEQNNESGNSNQMNFKNEDNVNSVFSSGNKNIKKEPKTEEKIKKNLDQETPSKNKNTNSNLNYYALKEKVIFLFYKLKL